METIAKAVWVIVGFAVTVCGQTAENRRDVAVLEGRSLSQDGSPLRKAALTLVSEQGKPGEMVQPYRATSDAEGHYTFDGVEPGGYRLFANHAGFLPSAYGARKNNARGTVLTLTAGQQLGSMDITLAPEATISGKVVDDDGEPVAAVQINLQRSSYRNGKAQLAPAGQGQTNNLGEFQLSSLPSGRYILSAKPRTEVFEPGRQTRGQQAAAKTREIPVPTYYPGSMDASSASPLDVRAGQEMRGIDIRLRKSGVFRVKGVVSGAVSTAPGQRVTVFLSRRGAEGSFDFDGAATPGKDGWFAMDDIPPGEYVVMVAHASFAQRGSVHWEDAAADKSGKALDNVSISIKSSEGSNERQAAVHEDGSFVLEDIPPDKHRLRMPIIPAGAYVKSARLDDHDLLADDLDLTNRGGKGSISRWKNWGSGLRWKRARSNPFR